MSSATRMSLVRPKPDIPDDLVEQSKLERARVSQPARSARQRVPLEPSAVEQTEPRADVRQRGQSNRRAKCDAVRRRDHHEAHAAGRRAHRRHQTSSALTVEDTEGRVLFFAPVTTGSQHDPLADRELEGHRRAAKPAFHYNPDLFWDADPTHSKAKIPSRAQQPRRRGMDRHEQAHYGIHGTPEPSTIGTCNHTAAYG